VHLDYFGQTVPAPRVAAAGEAVAGPGALELVMRQHQHRCGPLPRRGPVAPATRAVQHRTPTRTQAMQRPSQSPGIAALITSETSAVSIAGTAKISPSTNVSPLWCGITRSICSTLNAGPHSTNNPRQR